MIFRDIKQHNKVYILDKMNVTIDEGIVTAVGIPQPNMEGKIVIDVTINVKDKHKVNFDLFFSLNNLTCQPLKKHYVSQ